MGVIEAILTASKLVASLSQTATNGNSALGTLNAPLLADFLTNNDSPPVIPWGTKKANTINPYEQSLTTNVSRVYDFTIKRGFIAPDGVNKSVILVNGQFPAPTIEANWGDTIQVTVHNQITNPEEGTSLHWHGILQRETPWFDGVPAVQQCPIPPGKSLNYTFKADLYGTTWYHSHYSAQYAGGLFGPLIIHGPKNVPYDLDLGPVLLSDWYHDDYFDIVERVMTPSLQRLPPPLSDNNLINGKMNFDCTLVTNGQACTPNAGLSKFKFTSGKKHRLRLINASAEAIQRFTIDNHTMTVMANDFVPIQPYETNVVTLGVGQRTDVIVEAKLPPESEVFMRSIISSKCSFAHQHQALAVIYYDGADTTSVPTSVATPIDDSVCGNDPLDKTIPFFPFPATQAPETTVTIGITFEKNATNYWLWNMNKSSFRANYNHPILLLANKGNTSYPFDPEWNVYNFGNNNSVRVIVENHFPAAHPMHLHGHNFNVLSEGPGTWNGTINHIENTQRRDVQLLQPSSQVTGEPSHLVIQYNTDNA
ncbi:hypothetical protein MMC31_002586, partial [Peltigera leucophlebia]|nr:hypothetical protein [Peltigera leucophlebia]